MFDKLSRLNSKSLRPKCFDKRWLNGRSSAWVDINYSGLQLAASVTRSPRALQRAPVRTHPAALT
jgi:hypothetical protein